MAVSALEGRFPVGDDGDRGQRALVERRSQQEFLAGFIGRPAAKRGNRDTERDRGHGAEYAVRNFNPGGCECGAGLKIYLRAVSAPFGKSPAVRRDLDHWAGRKGSNAWSDEGTDIHFPLARVSHVNNPFSIRGNSCHALGGLRGDQRGRLASLRCDGEDVSSSGCTKQKATVSRPVRNQGRLTDVLDQPRVARATDILRIQARAGSIR